MRASILGIAARSKNLQNTTTNTSDSSSNNTTAKAITSTNATPTQQRPTRPPLRTPLQSRDSNAMMRVPPVTKGNSSNMPPYDKHNAPRPPLKPTLSASTKTVNRMPLTPRVAGSTPSNTGTSSSRRPARAEVSTTPVVKEDAVTPVSTFLSHNITPRSGPRRVRVESPNSTPTGTPTAAQALDDSTRGADTPPTYGSGLGIAGIDKDLPKHPTVSFSPSPADLGQPKSQNGTGDSKFFFASEAKAAVQPTRPPLPSKSSSSFFYANGNNIPNKPQSSNASAVGSTVGEDRPKFLHANGTPDLQATPYLPPPRPSSIVSSNSRMASPRLGTPTSSTTSPPQRPSSPSKLNQYASISSIGSTPALPSPVTPRPQVLGRGYSANGLVSARKASIEAGQRSSHGRSSSGSSAEGKLPPPLRNTSGGSYNSSVPGSPSNPIATSVPTYMPEEASEETPKDGGLAAGFRSPISSPVKTHSIDELNELAANARRERKVLDLEITNSSLAAINRTLEREMRKQTAELRRFRRLSRSGRLSIATSASVRTSSGSVSGFETENLTDLSEEEEEEGETESEEETSDEGSLSPSAMEESDLRHRKRDEKRLQLDLSKHQRLLIDSQKMNQSLKRCLGWTEELINEGKKALEYRVRISDVELGGRVLALDEVEGAEEPDNEGLSDIGARMLREARKAAANGMATHSTWASQGRDDRDSGIELDGGQREHIPISFAETSLEP
ncbi:uncharacterized protein RSE6_04862 [Rhynchosporium secalis]|uniref:Uncharacterized protein n=1 Tax=Rhynchosporium secalis TaxID=38038 RepID=A0A1E1M6D3_RHYSE|nr:uncharacterized protein RSE6_04862 [Rhynchosporium secalis]